MNIFNDENSNSWALVTGASVGIGREFCLQLAAAKINLILVSRREDLLKKLATEINANYQVKTLVVPTDLSTLENIIQLHKIINEQGIKIRILVNDAALGTEKVIAFSDAPLTDALSIIQVNIVALVSL